MSHNYTVNHKKLHPSYFYNNWNMSIHSLVIILCKLLPKLFLTKMYLLKGDFSSQYWKYQNRLMKQSKFNKSKLIKLRSKTLMWVSKLTIVHSCEAGVRSDSFSINPCIKTWGPVGSVAWSMMLWRMPYQASIKRQFQLIHILNILSLNTLLQYPQYLVIHWIKVGTLGSHRSGDMKLRVMHFSSSVVSRARWAGALSCWNA